MKHTRYKNILLLLVGMVIVYFLTHMWNFQHAPWNVNGLLDDAAWDIYFAKNHVLVPPIQPVYFDTVGYISREVLFGYYISFFFAVFGYNVLVFNVALLVLGCITVCATALCVQKVFKNTPVTIMAFVILNFLPFHFMHVFMGHRYAIAAPLMMVSLFFLYCALEGKSAKLAALSGIFAALCMGSSVMGKQYPLGLAIGGWWAWARKNFRVILYWMIGFVVAGLPLFFYILFHRSEYSIREYSLLQDFLRGVHSGGLEGLAAYGKQLGELFFAPHSGRRQFLSEFPLLPYAYYSLLVPGFFLAWRKKHYELVALSVIPVVGAFVSGAFDFRVLLAAPIWVFIMAFTIHAGFGRSKFVAFGMTLVILAGLVPSVVYIWHIAHKADSQYLLAHETVAVSRLLQDIVVGVPIPSSSMKWNELNRYTDIRSVEYDTLICTDRAHATAHVFLQNYDDKKILSFCNQGIMSLMKPEEILAANMEAIRLYTPNSRDLKLIWEVSEKSEKIISEFAPYTRFGSEISYAGVVDGEQFRVYVLTIQREHLDVFKKQVMANTSLLFEK